MMNTTENQSENEVAYFVENSNRILTNSKRYIVDEIRYKITDEEDEKFFKYDTTTNQCLFDTIKIPFSIFVKPGRLALTIPEMVNYYIEKMRGITEAENYMQEEDEK